ncbi:MAG: hypothetical protein H6851_18260 [Geminicoccaceae bacterium]|nr:hypothetical protein [Geminicoccaceae bacterium]
MTEFLDPKEKILTAKVKTAEPRHRARCAGRLTALVALAMSMATPVHAGILVEGVIEGVPVRFEMGADRTRVMARIDGKRHLVDLAHDHVYELDMAVPKRIRAGLHDDGASSAPYRLTEWSAGPPVGGHGSKYNVLQLDELVCGEVLSSRWMLDFLKPVIRSVEIMQRLARSIRPRPRGECGAIPFEAYARNGWPLMAGWKDATVVLTDTVRFDYKADAHEFDLPQRYRDE